jgi:hypothetical protein
MGMTRSVDWLKIAVSVVRFRPWGLLAFPAQFFLVQRTCSELGNPAMSDVRDFLISGSYKVIERYRLLLAGAKKRPEREF